MRISMRFAFRIHSADCRLLGLDTSTKLSRTENTRYSAFATVTVDFPHCREQFKIPRFAVDRSTSACRSSGLNPSRVLANSTSSILVFGRLITCRVPSPTKLIGTPSLTKEQYHCNRPYQPLENPSIPANDRNKKGTHPKNISDFLVTARSG
jgi:hypothetical protein